jgi:hypothetical protein
MNALLGILDFDDDRFDLVRLRFVQHKERRCQGHASAIECVGRFQSLELSLQ